MSNDVQAEDKKWDELMKQDEAKNCQRLMAHEQKEE